ncbi:hypothetical protein TYRP_003598 [Tyrophagus putrescentiae]|nr:hypothetical protein TYRP_003598 [Tyrophagus putrescentiae]
MLTAPLTQWTKSRARRLPLDKKIELGGVGDHPHRFSREEKDFKLQTLMNMLNDYKIILWRRLKEPSNA